MTHGVTEKLKLFFLQIQIDNVVYFSKKLVLFSLIPVSSLFKKEYWKHATWMWYTMSG